MKTKLRFESKLKNSISGSKRRLLKEIATVASFYSDEATRYLGGRRVDFLEGLEFCRKLPRPFGGKGARPTVSDNFYLLSENAAYFVRTIDFEPADENSPAFKREVVTKVWSRTNDGWKIVHFHSSVHSISDA